MSDNNSKIIMPNKELIIPGQENDKPAAANPMKEMDRIIRTIQLAKNKGKDTLMQVLAEINNNGWPMAVDGSLPTGHVVITLTSHLWREAKAGPQMHNEQIIRLGTQYEPAIKAIKEHAAKHRQENSPEGEENPDQSGETQTQNDKEKTNDSK